MIFESHDVPDHNHNPLRPSCMGEYTSCFPVNILYSENLHKFMIGVVFWETVRLGVRVKGRRSFTLTPQITAADRGEICGPKKVP